MGYGIMMDRNWFVFDGISSKDYGAYIDGTDTFKGAERDVTSISVPGRNGDVIIDNGRFKNVKLDYRMFIFQDFPKNIEAFRNALLNVTGYKRLEDTFHPDEFRLARISGSFDAVAKKTLMAGGLTLSFDCKPQRFLKSGENSIGYVVNGSIYNPTYMQAKPLVTVLCGSRIGGRGGTVTISGVTITISDSIPYDVVDIDCDTQDAYNVTNNCNQYITLQNGKFFELAPGNNDISFSGKIFGVKITPRWWII